MKTPLEGVERRVVPRWRPTALAATLPGGLPLVTGSQRQLVIRGDEAGLERLQRAFLGKQTFPFAADLLSAAVASGQADLAHDAAEVIIVEARSLPPALVDLAQHVLGRKPIAGRQRELPPDTARSTIRALRSRLNRYDSNALDWVDLALAYVSLGQRKKAERAVRAALGLSSSNRHVLRSAARYFVHAGDPGRALATLKRAPNLLADPWLLSAEVAVSNIAGRTSRHIKQAKQLVEAARFNRLDTSELAAAIASEEAASGNIKGAVRRMRLALEAPTDNTLAQGEWFSHQVSDLGDLGQQAGEIPRAFEANASISLYRSSWTEALAAAGNWGEDEPYSSRPAMLASFVSGMILEDHYRSIETLEAALRIQPGDAGLTNNLAFSYASIGRTEDARVLMSSLAMGAVSGSLLVAAEATRGLIAFRSGFDDEGLRGYLEAIERARREGIRSSECMARAMLGRELGRVGKKREAAEQLRLAIELQERLPADKRNVVEAVVGACNAAVQPGDHGSER